MGLLKRLFSNIYVKHFSLTILSVIIFLWLIFLFLSYYTRHNETFTVPNFIGLNLEQIVKIAADNNLEYRVIDSVFDSKKIAKTIVLQDPLPKTKVKKGRVVYLTFVASAPEQIEVPNLIDLTQRQAVSLLEMYGLKLGKVTYVPDIGKTVLKQLYNGKPFSEGFMIKKGSSIDLVIGKGPDNEPPEDFIPNDDETNLNNN